MPEFLRALIAIVVLAGSIFVLAPRIFPAAVMNPEDFRRRRNLWFGVTATLFLANNFWIYILVAGLLIWRAAIRESNKVALLFFVLFAAPTIADRIPGMGLVNFLIEISYPRLLALTVLLPAYLALRADAKATPFGQLLPDKFVAGYIALQVLLLLPVSSITNTMRAGVVYSLLDIFLPYYVASRALQRLDDFREAMIAFTIAGLVLGTIAVFETARHWLLYTPLNDTLDIKSGYGIYLARGDEGSLLRAQGSTGHAIPLGYAMAMSLAAFYYVRGLAASPRLANLVWLVLLAGLIAPQSRGPWVGAAALILLLVLTGPSAAKGVARIAVLSLIGIAALAPTDFGQNLFLNTLSSIGEEDDTLSYRTRLFQVSIVIILENPFFGSYDFLSQMEEMRQGQGIIDLVNTFIAVSLSSGLVGLSLFIGCFLTAAFGIVRGMHRLESRESEHYRLGQALLAALVGTLIIISSTSSITVIPVIYWPLIGVGVAYARLVRGSPGVETGQGAAASGIGANSFPLATARASAPGRALL